MAGTLKCDRFLISCRSVFGKASAALSVCAGGGIAIFFLPERELCGLFFFWGGRNLLRLSRFPGRQFLSLYFANGEGCLRALQRHCFMEDPLLLFLLFLFEFDRKRCRYAASLPKDPVERFFQLKREFPAQAAVLHDHANGLFSLIFDPRFAKIQSHDMRKTPDLTD